MLAAESRTVRAPAVATLNPELPVAWKQIVEPLEPFLQAVAKRLEKQVKEFDPAKQSGTGFGFAPFTHEALLDCARRALTVFRQPALWRRLVENAMAEDFSWEASAREYVSLYRKALKAAAR